MSDWETNGDDEVKAQSSTPENSVDVPRLPCVVENWAILWRRRLSMQRVTHR